MKSPVLPILPKVPWDDLKEGQEYVLHFRKYLNIIFTTPMGTITEKLVNVEILEKDEQGILINDVVITSSVRVKYILREEYGIEKSYFFRYKT